VIRRREFITLLGGAAAALPKGVRAQSTGMLRVGMVGAQPRSSPIYAGFLQSRPSSAIRKAATSLSSSFRRRTSKTTPAPIGSSLGGGQSQYRTQRWRPLHLPVSGLVRSSERVCCHRVRATGIGSMPSLGHQAASFPER